jgi:tRNA nucleotidyltransferase (CCA-adding enzyme)
MNMKNVKLSLPDEVGIIFSTLRNAGFECYCVGGCVRDAFLESVPSDWDIATNAKPSDVVGLFQNTLSIGAKHGTITILVDNIPVEVTTYRVDGEYADHRRPLNVEYTASIEEDLARRDFTFNAMAYSPESGILDPYGGLTDLKNGIIRCVGDPFQRFSEDALRMMRAIRFSARFGFRIEPATYDAIVKNAGLIAHVSPERIYAEIKGIFISDHPDHAAFLFETGLMDSFFDQDPECSAVLCKTLPMIENSFPLRFAAVFDTGADPSATLASLRFPRSEANEIKKTVKNLNIVISPEERSLRITAGHLGGKLLHGILSVRSSRVALLFGQNSQQKKGSDELVAILDSILDSGICLSPDCIAISGDDLIRLGIPPGRTVGKILHELFELVLDDPSMNRPDRLIAYVRSKCL